MPIGPGTKLGAYEVTKLIGQGGMGLVYEARHEALDRLAAVKVMLAIEQDPAGAARFRREGQAIAHLRHANILTVYDFGDFDGVPYMIVEHVAGGSLFGRLKAGRLPRPKVIELLRGIAAGLDHAHAMGVVHRDIKPANVLMGPGDSPILADFGLAKMQQSVSMTASGVTTGTPAYMAPEQIEDGVEVGSPADIYAFATVAYEMLTGRLPYESDSVMKLLMSKVRDDPVPPTKRDPDLPRKVDSILQRGLARDPTVRWTAAAAMVEALANALEPTIELYAPTQQMRRKSAPDLKRWAWLAFPLAGVLALVVVFGVLPRLPRTPNPTGQVSTVVPCLARAAPDTPPPTPPPPQTIQASPNPAQAGDTVTFSATGFDPGSGFFITIDAVGDCLNNPLGGTVVATVGSFTDPFTSDPVPLPASIQPNEYWLRACNQVVGAGPNNCVQVPFSVTAAPSPSPGSSPAPSPSSSPAESPSPT